MVGGTCHPASSSEGPFLVFGRNRGGKNAKGGTCLHLPGGKLVSERGKKNDVGSTKRSGSGVLPGGGNRLGGGGEGWRVARHSKGERAQLPQRGKGETKVIWSPEAKQRGLREDKMRSHRRRILSTVVVGGVIVRT